MCSIEGSFSKYSRSYDKYAIAQNIGAEMFRRRIQEFDAHKLRNRNILEFGCGTGILSSHIAETFPESNLFFSDISHEMVNCCRAKLENKKGLKKNFFVGNGEFFYRESGLSAVFSSFTIQWFKDYLKAIDNYYSSLEEGGRLLISFQGPESFPQWKSAANDLGLPFTGNEMPDPLKIENFARKRFRSCSMENKQIDIEFNSALDFFNSLKFIGALSKTNNLSCSPGELLKLIKYWNRKEKNQIKITYSLWFLSGEK